MLKSKKMNVIGQILIFCATLAWGTSFFILKETISEVPAFYVIALRFLTASVLLGLIFFKKIKTIDKKTVLRGFVLGLALTAAYVTQTTGLKFTTPGRNAFLTSMYCVLCPFLMWIMFKKRPKFYNVIAAVLCVVGIGLVALSGDSQTGENLLLGDGLTIAGAVFFGIQLVFIDRFQKQGSETAQLLVVELLTVGVLHAVASLIFELPVSGISGYSLNLEQILKIGYLTLACTLFAQFAQTFGQRFVSANQSAIILSLEAVFGVVFSMLFAGEKLTLRLAIGFCVIFISVLISELKIDFRKLFKKEKTMQNCVDVEVNNDKEQ